MTAPSLLHEDRVRAIAAVATLAGYTVDAVIYNRERPDVTRLHPRRPALLIGDGKASETPTDRATLARLVAYSTAARIWLSAGFTVDLAICHGADPRNDWLKCLAHVADAAGILASDPSCTEFDDTTWLSRVGLEMRRSPHSRISGTVA